MDGIGGMDERVVSREVMSGRASVDSSRKFATVATDNCKEKKLCILPRKLILN